MTAADLRHSLRTPLNHIIGFGEMVLEECEGRAASTPVLAGLCGSARDLVQTIQNIPLPGSGELAETEMRQLRARLLEPVNGLRESVGKLEDGPDVAKIRLAVEQLVAFAEDRPDSLAGLTPALPGAARTGTDAGGARGHLLIVDDNAANRDILQRHLERQGYAVSTATNGQQCLDLLGAGSFDLVLLDVLMPVMDGFEVLGRIQVKPAIRGIPVVMISALDETASVVRCIQMGAEDYLMKPFDPVLLSARIGASLEKKRLRNEERRRTEELQQAVDELKRTQAQLLVQDKLASLGAMTAGIAHEIRNPLNFITNFAAAAVEIVRELRESPGEPELLNQLERYVGKIDEHGKRAERIVRSMLLHSRGKAGNPELVDINALLTDCVHLAYHGLRAQDRKFNVRLETIADPALPPVLALPQEISRVFLNIVNNACYAAWQRKERSAEPFEPVVTTTTRATDTGVEIRIRDNGGGIPEEVLPKIFNPFFTTKPAGVGTGLGLSLSYEIVTHMHQGTLRAESMPGQGAEFIVCLPRPTPERKS